METEQLTIGQQEELLSGAECLDSNLLQILLCQCGEGGQVNLVTQEHICVLGQSLIKIINKG